MRQYRLITREEVGDLKGMTEVCLKLGGGMTSFAKVTRVGISDLSKYASPSDEFADRVIGLDVAIEADRRAKDPMIIREAARLLGYELTKLTGEVGESGGPATEQDAMRIMDEATNLWTVWRASYADQYLDGQERQRLTRKLHELIRAAQILLDKIADGAAR